MQPLSSLSPTRATVAPPEAPASRPAARPAPVERSSSPTLPNPALRLDAELGLVVLQFRDNNGKVVETIPTERELAAYRSGSSPTRQPGRAGTPAAPAAAPVNIRPASPAEAPPATAPAAQGATAEVKPADDQAAPTPNTAAPTTRA